MVRPSNEMKLYRNGQTGLNPIWMVRPSDEIKLNINGQTKQLIKTKYKWSDQSTK